MAEHVVYEVKAFQSSIRALAALKKTDEAWNRTLESTLLHFRILRGFFIDDPKGNDASARDR
jgi:hypothetical protein